MTDETNQAPASSTSAESSTPATSTTTSAAPEGAASGDQFDFGALATHDEYAEPSSGTEGTPATAELAQQPAPVAPQPATPQATPVVPAPAAAAPPPVPTTEQQAGQPPRTATEEATAFAEPLSLEQHRNNFIPQLARLYEVSEAEVEALQGDLGNTLPTMAARLHYEVQMATHQGIMSVLPQMIGQYMQTHQKSETYNNQFYDKWPALKGAVAQDVAKEKVIVNAIQSYRNLNPKAPIEDVMARAGLLAMMTLGLPLDVPGAPPNGGGAAPAAFTSSSPVRPAGIGASGPIPTGGAGPGLGDAGDIISELVSLHERGEI